MEEAGSPTLSMSSMVSTSIINKLNQAYKTEGFGEVEVEKTEHGALNDLASKTTKTGGLFKTIKLAG